jgi:hypothetical protein
MVVVPKTLETMPIITSRRPTPQSERRSARQSSSSPDRPTGWRPVGGQVLPDSQDGCAEDGEKIEAGDPFFFDTETGEILCEEHGAARRE